MQLLIQFKPKNSGQLPFFLHLNQRPINTGLKILFSKQIKKKKVVLELDLQKVQNITSTQKKKNKGIFCK